MDVRMSEKVRLESVFILKNEPFVNHRWKVKAVGTARWTHFWIPRRWSFRCWSHLIISDGISQNWCRTASCETSIHVDKIEIRLRLSHKKIITQSAYFCNAFSLISPELHIFYLRLAKSSKKQHYVFVI